MRSSVIIWTAILLVTWVTGLAAGSDTVLEYKDVQFFKVVELPGRPVHGLKISGLAFHSALAVEKITTETIGTASIVYIHLVPAKPGLSGSFEYDLAVPDSIKEVQFGRGKIIIWTRK